MNLGAILGPWSSRLRGIDGLVGPTVVGCSGGPDSLALVALAAAAGLSPIAVHVDHGIRADTTADVGAVRDAAERLGVAWQVERRRVSPGPNLEARARTARYEALETARAREGASAVLVGHTADDQAETVLLNLLRGAGSTGLAGMATRRDSIVRPLLGLRRAETHAVCAVLGLAPVADPMNDDPAFVRVRLRHEVLPLLDQVARRDVAGVLARQADVLRDESELLDRLAEAAWPDPRHGPRARDLAVLEPALARRAVRRWLGAPPPGFAEVERVLRVAAGDHRSTELAGGRAVRRRGGLLEVSGASGARAHYGLGA